ncbi:Peptidase C1A, papain C-terminal [uncultured Caudovirales phage]|uniref:Peptidase C1A, papain C-terminal n=1 Tax=uncultured Caudovirales phage TaxID=2100421 RepID=A0A6J7XQB9_9CAUD|nr:Peptidase C1A, papain C-terminal [uncultured Caudovirales phage]
MSDLEQWITPDGETRYLGNRQSTLMLVSNFQLPDIPDSELREFDFRNDSKYPVAVKDQDGRGACNGHAAASSYEDACYIAGLPYVAISAWSIYAPLCNGWDIGSSIAEALVLMRDHGAAEESYVPYGTIDPRKLSKAALENRAEHRIEIGCRLNSFRELCIAAHLRMPFNFSVPVNSGFNNLDDEGVPRNTSGPHNHAVSGGFALKRSKRYGIILPTRNSWKTTWGWNGYFNTANKTVEGSGWDAYCVIATIAGQRILPPKLS